VTDKPIRYLIYSHEHTDQFGVTSLFPPGIKIVAQETAVMLKRRKDPRRLVPTVTFRDHLTITLGDQKLELIYPGLNHQAGNIMIWAPLQKTLMLVDVVYPGYMPYKNLGIVEDVPGYIQVHRKILGYEFATFVGGHVDRLGDRKDVETSLAFATQLFNVANRILTKTTFPAYLASQPGPEKWDLHNECEHTLVEECAAELSPMWEGRLKDTPTLLVPQEYAKRLSSSSTTPGTAAKLPGEPATWACGNSDGF